MTAATIARLPTSAIAMTNDLSILISSTGSRLK
jgi:hypothetical protein